MANAAVVVTGAEAMEVVEVADSVADAAVAVVVVVETATTAENLAIWLVIVATKFAVEVAAVDLEVVPTTALATNASNPDTSPATAQTSESVALTPH